MLKRFLTTLFLVPALILAFQPGPAVQGVVMTPEELATLSATVEADDAGVEKPKQEGNGFLRALKAPFKAIGRIFGGGKKKKSDDNNASLQRISEKDQRKFESAPRVVINDATSTTKEPPSNVNRTTTSGDFSLHLAKGRELLNAGDVTGAIGELTLATSIDPKSAETKNLLGVAYEAKGLRRLALESFKAAVEADKDNAEYLNNYGFLLFKNGDNDEATKQLKRAAKLSPKDARIWNNLGLVQCHRGKFDDAFRSFARAVGDFNGHINLAAQLSSLGHAKEAIRHLEMAQSMQPNSVDVLAKLVSLYEMTGRLSDAETARRSIVALRTFADANK
jgi:Flp pilus assembly protein TadD